MTVLVALVWAVLSGLATAAIDLHLLSFPHASTPIVALGSAAVWFGILAFVVWMAALSDGYF